jgi:hypothetical protein
MVDYNTIFAEAKTKEHAQEKPISCADEKSHAQEMPESVHEPSTYQESASVFSKEDNEKMRKQNDTADAFRYATGLVESDRKLQHPPNMNPLGTSYQMASIDEKGNAHINEVKAKDVYHDPKPDVFDLEIAKSKLDADNVNELILKAEMLVVETDEEAQNGVSMACQSKKMRNKIEATRKQIVRPHLDFQKSIKLYADDFAKCLQKLETTVLKKVNVFQDKKNLELKKAHEEQMRQERAEEEARIKIEQEKIKEEQEKIKEEQEKAKKEGKVMPLPPPLPIIETKQEVFVPPPQKITTESGTLTTVVIWTYEVKDESLVPREYLSVNHKEIKLAVAGGIRKVPGIRIFEKSETRSRVR